MTDRRLLFFGDSLVAGVGDPSGRGWVGQIVAASFGGGLPFTAYNLGVRRETSEQVAARWRSEALPRLLPEADMRIVVSFGANDTTIEHGRLRVAPERSCAALDGILEGAGALGLTPLVIGPAPVDNAQQNERIHALSASFSEICSNAGVSFIGVVEQLLATEIWMTQVMAGDGAHPSAEGYDALADLILAAGWKDWLRAELATAR
ncbi:MAG TPA: GDSL-type esterase/lipase family protein [Solirubrobacteraceae bacterium]|nr:GDSL-type esterase/lipase family protein [Solirubrobacteraceae bacterium]